MYTNNQKNEFEGISERARKLLEREEGYDVEFKESISGLENSDFVSFANSDGGGAILLGIKEEKAPNGKQLATIVGHPIGDDVKQSIISKALSCIPPVGAEVYYENVSDKPFIRIEIPAGDNKPYCTQGGRYKIRRDGRSSGMRPSMIFNILIEKEYLKFSKRFKEATSELEKQLVSLKDKVTDKMTELYRNLEDMEKKTTKSLNNIMKAADKAESLSDETSTISDRTFENVCELQDKIKNMEEILNALKDILGKE